MKNIRLNINPEMSTTVYIRDSFDDFYSRLEREKEVVAVIDKNVERIYGGCFPYKKIVIGVSEKTKTLKTIVFIIGELLKEEVSRNCLLLGVGGGILTDIVGFVASIYKRGIRCAYVSTSLLGQVDASIGGKTGVNYKGYKNIIGSISQPIFSYLNLSVLNTLSDREYYCGVSEMLKMFIISDMASYKDAIEIFSKKRPYDKESIEKLLATAVKLKSWIVEKDAMEKGERRLLNLGHTFGHAIEKCSDDENKIILHGEAISMGLIISAKLSNKLGFLSQDNLTKIISDYKKIGLPTECPFQMEKLLKAIRLDKKREGNDIHFVLIKNIGSAFLKTISIDELTEVSYDLH